MKPFILFHCVSFAIFYLLIQTTSSTFVTSNFYSSEIIANNISTPRGLLIDESGDILVLSRGSSSIISLYSESGNSSTFSQTEIINGQGLGLNHGIAYSKGHLYASSGSTVYRWPYTPGQRSLVTDREEIVISNISIPDEKKQNTRTLIFDDKDLFYVTINSDIRLDPFDSRRCRINRFNITTLPSHGGGIEFNAGEVFADGLRNEVGLAFDLAGILWGVENAGGADYLIRDDLGGNIHEGNPAEELNRLNKPPGTHYGYPFCFGSYDLPGHPIGTQFVWPTAMNDTIHSDDWCRQEANNERATLFLPPHTAPLGIDFFKGEGCSASDEESSKTGAFPCSATGNAVIAYHGSINISKPVGYKVTMYTFDGEGNDKLPTGSSVDIIYDPDETKSFRPVNAVFNKLGHLIITADASSQIIRVTYSGSDSTGFAPRNMAQSYIVVLFFMIGGWLGAINFPNV